MIIKNLLESNNFILILGSFGTRSIKSSCWRELLQNNYECVKVVLLPLLDLPRDEQIEELSKFIEQDKVNHVIFNLPTDFVKKLPNSFDYIRNLGSCTISCFLLDSFERLAYENAQSLPLVLLNKMNIFDKIYSFSWHDHVKYNFTYHHTPICYVNDSNTGATLPSYDVFFIGRKKGRIKRLRLLADYFEAHGISYLFLVLKVSDLDKDYKNIKFISYLSYDEMINSYVRKSKCLLSLCGRRATDPTLAYYESMIYNKKLLTDAEIINSIPFTNSNNQKYFSLIDDIDVNWIKSPIKSEYTVDKHEFESVNFLRHVAVDFQLYNYEFNYGSTSPIVALNYLTKGWSYQSLGSGVEGDTGIESVCLINIDADISVFQKIHGWSTSPANELCGVIGESLPITAIKIDSKTCNFKYRVYMLNIGWTEWVSDGAICGFVEFPKGSEDIAIGGIQIIANSVIAAQ